MLRNKEYVFKCLLSKTAGLDGLLFQHVAVLRKIPSSINVKLVSYAMASELRACISVGIVLRKNPCISLCSNPASCWIVNVQPCQYVRCFERSVLVCVRLHQSVPSPLCVCVGWGVWMLMSENICRVTGMLFLKAESRTVVSLLVKGSGSF